MARALLHGLTTLALVLHIGGGTVGLASGTIAALARKGGPLHRAAGRVFFVSMLVMAACACWLAVAIPGAIVNLFIGIFVLYLVATAWLTARRRAGESGLAEKLLLAVALLLCAPFALLSFQLATGMAPFFRSSIPLRGPVLIAIYSFTSVIAIAATGDARLAVAGGISGTPRLARHLWRMCLALTLATGSAFTNGLARLLPAPMGTSDLLLLPQFVWVGFLIVWMVRLRLGRDPAAIRRAPAPDPSAS